MQPFANIPLQPAAPADQHAVVQTACDLAVQPHAQSQSPLDNLLLLATIAADQIAMETEAELATQMPPVAHDLHAMIAGQTDEQHAAFFVRMYEEAQGGLAGGEEAAAHAQAQIDALDRRQVERDPLDRDDESYGDALAEEIMNRTISFASSGGGDEDMDDEDDESDMDDGEDDDVNENDGDDDDDDDDDDQDGGDEAELVEGASQQAEGASRTRAFRSKFDK